MAGSIHVGVGGWDFDPWRGTFYPAGLAKTKQLEHLGARLTATEINATYYKLQSPALFERWGRMVPDGFKFAVKASRFCTNRKCSARPAESIGKFCAQGFTELGDKLGPILWQMMPTKKFDAAEIRDFFPLLPTSRDGMSCATRSSRATRASNAASSWRWRGRPMSRSSSPITRPIRRSPI